MQTELILEQNNRKVDLEKSRVLPDAAYDNYARWSEEAFPAPTDEEIDRMYAESVAQEQIERGTLI